MAAAPLPPLPPHPLPRLAPVPRPAGWAALPVHRKIAHYGAHLGPVHAALADKLAAKRYVQDVCPALGLAGLVTTARVLRVLEGWEDLRADDLAQGSIVKATHGCKWQILGKGAAPGDEQQGQEGEREAKKKLRAWSGRSWTSVRSPQRHYALIPPRFFVEEVLADALAPPGQALCYMVRCIAGRPASLSVLRGKLQNSYYPGSGARIARELRDPELDPCPRLRSALLRAAAALAAPFEFVRVDFHVPEPRAESPLLYFSEFTFTPAAGARVFPAKEERRQGRLWR